MGLTEGTDDAGAARRARWRERAGRGARADAERADAERAARTAPEASAPRRAFGAGSGVDRALVDEVVADMRRRWAEAGARRRAEPGADGGAAVVPVIPPDDPDVMLATALGALAGADARAVDFGSMTANGAYGSRRVGVAVGEDGHAVVQLYEGGLFSGQASATRAAALEALLTALVRDWTFG